MYFIESKIICTKSKISVKYYLRPISVSKVMTKQAVKCLLV